MKVDLIILVDDNPITIFYNRDQVDDIFPGVEVVSYENSKEFINDFIGLKFREKENILLLLDINMPEYCGYEVLSELEDECDDLDNLSVIMLTSSTLKVDQEKATRFVNVKGYVEKPLDEIKLGAFIELPKKS